MSSVHAGNLGSVVRRGEEMNDAKFIFWSLYWYPKVSVWMGQNGAWWIQVVSLSKWWVSLDLYAHAFYACFFKGEEVLLFCNWRSRCTHVLFVMCDTAIGLQSKSINPFKDAATGPILSLTTDHMCLLHSLDFGGCIQWSRFGNCFWLCLLLVLTLSM